MSRPGLRLAVLAFAACVAAQALAQSAAPPSSRALFRWGHVIVDFDTDLIWYLGEFGKLPQGDRYAAVTRLRSKLAEVEKAVAQARCRLDLSAYTRRLGTLVEAAVPDPKTQAEPADQVIPFFLAFNQCVDEQAPLAMRDYFFYGATVGEIRYMLETLPMPAGTVDAEVLDRLDRLALISSQLTERKEFPEAARACAGRLQQLAEAHATKKAMDETARKEAGTCARQIGQAFL